MFKVSHWISIGTIALGTMVTLVSFKVPRWTVHSLSPGMCRLQATMLLGEFLNGDTINFQRESLWIKLADEKIAMVTSSTLERNGTALLRQGSTESQVVDYLGKPASNDEMGQIERRALDYPGLGLQIIVQKADDANVYTVQSFTLYSIGS